MLWMTAAANQRINQYTDKDEETAMEDSQYDWDEEFVNREIMRGRLWGMGILVVCAIAALCVAAWLMLKPASADEPPMPKFQQPECLPLSSVLGALLMRFHETPLFVFHVGDEDQTMMVVNQQTGTVTQIAACSTKDGHEGASVILTGTHFKAMDVDDLKKLLGPKT